MTEWIARCGSAKMRRINKKISPPRQTTSKKNPLLGKRSLKYEPNPYTGTLINTGMRARTHVHNDRTSSSQSGLGVFPVYERRHLLASPQNAKHLDAFPALHFINVSRGFKPGEMPARLNNFLANKTLSLRLSSRVMMMNDAVWGGTA